VFGRDCEQGDYHACDYLSGMYGDNRICEVGVPPNAALAERWHARSVALLEPLCAAGGEARCFHLELITREEAD